jgi:hypothetical protein
MRSGVKVHNRRGWWFLLAALWACEPRHGKAQAAASGVAIAPRIVPKPTQSAAQPPAVPDPVQHRFKLRAFDQAPQQFLPEALGAAGAKPGQVKAGDGCKKPLLIEMQGYADDAPVRATVEVQGRRIAIRSVQVDTRARATLNGSLPESFCGHSDWVEPVAFKAVTQGSKRATYDCFLGQNSYFEVDRGRVHLEANPPDPSSPSLTLRETAPQRVAVRDAYQPVLKHSSDVEAVVVGDASKYLAYLTLDDRDLFLAEIGGTPAAVLREVRTGLKCELHECSASVAAFQLTPEPVVLVASVAGENCGAKCTRSAEAEIWTLDASGFHGGTKLPPGYEMMGGISYEGSSSQTTASWVDGDGVAPLEILLETRDSNAEEVSRTVLAYEPETHAYSASEPLTGVSDDAVAELRGPELISY